MWRCKTDSIVSGTTGYTDYNGMAQEAKLAFFDIGDTETSALSVPSLYDSVFPAAKSAGAHIHSNSWGSSYQACDDSCYDIDRYTYENPVSAAYRVACESICS